MAHDVDIQILFLDKITDLRERSEAILERIEGRAGMSELTLQQETVCALVQLTQAVLLLALARVSE